MEIVGTIIRKYEVIQIGQKNTDKLQFVVETDDEKYPQVIPVNAYGDNVAKVQNISEGTRVRVGINLKGREWQDKYYLNADMWRIDVEVEDPRAMELETETKKDEDLPF
ncbi:MAG: hypothetical protein Unbinned5930contig1000_17 [Prokaryotic dsDNA virus sp.]|nr:MAG: hypothetical protein Unbinned5930contig1000_17 [Prokaryotic dsDNA virus sp.]|tara:strand:- start:3125 stop:3451 length:327 start_codon:yes stop_codon:yes gene_type:complete